MRTVGRGWNALVVAVGAACVAGCDLPPGAPPVLDLAGEVRVDGGGNLDLGGPLLDGNQLPLDGGPPGGLAHLVITISDGDTRLPVPARVIFRPVPGIGYADDILHGVQDPKSPGSLVGAVVGPGVLGSNEGVMLVSGQGVVPVPPGTYTLVLTRGPEYEQVEVPVTVGAGQVETVSATLEHSVDTRGWLAADMHVHLGRSFDSKLAIERRAISMVSNGVEVIVTTDHNVATDLSPVLLSLGYGPEVAGALVGDEFNFKEGHGGGYPIPYVATDPLGGAPPWIAPGADGSCPGINCMHDADAFARMHALLPGQTVVTINHPYWKGGDLGYFTNIDWGAGTGHPPPTPLATAGLFEALEVTSGYQANALSQDSLVADWFFLVGQGHRVTALGSSDTHKINWVRAGWPRSWLRLPNDRPGDTTGVGLSEAIRNNRAVASTGPFIRLTVDGGQIGDVVVPKTAGQVTVELSVDAPRWMAVDTVRLYVNGRVAQTWPVPPGQRPVFHAVLPRSIQGDAWMVAQATGAKALPPDVVGEYSQANGYDMLPWALTNPVFIDATGDGWTPPPQAYPPPRGPGPTYRASGPPYLGRGPIGPARSGRDFHGRVPPACDPSEIRAGEEPPLDGPALMLPLLFPER